MFATLLLSLHVFASVSLNPTALRQGSLQFPCVVNKIDTGTCAMDTGSDVALTMNPLQAKIDRITCTTQAAIETIGGQVSSCVGKTTLTIDGQTETVPVYVEGNWRWVPLVGVPALQEFWPDGMEVDWQTGEVTGF